MRGEGSHNPEIGADMGKLNKDKTSGFKKEGKLGAGSTERIGDKTPKSEVEASGRFGRSEVELNDERVDQKNDDLRESGAAQHEEIRQEAASEVELNDERVDQVIDDLRESWAAQHEEIRQEAATGKISPEEAAARRKALEDEQYGAGLFKTKEADVRKRVRELYEANPSMNHSDIVRTAMKEAFGRVSPEKNIDSTKTSLPEVNPEDSALEVAKRYVVAALNERGQNTEEETINEMAEGLKDYEASQILMSLKEGADKFVERKKRQLWKAAKNKIDQKYGKRAA